MFKTLDNVNKAKASGVNLESSAKVLPEAMPAPQLGQRNSFDVKKVNGLGQQALKGKQRPVASNAETKP